MNVVYVTDLVLLNHTVIVKVTKEIVLVIVMVQLIEMSVVSVKDLV